MCVCLSVCIIVINLYDLYTGGYSVFAGVGERTREGNDLYHEMIEGGVIKVRAWSHVNTHMYICVYVCVWIYVYI